MQVASYLKLSVAVAIATITLKTGAWWLTGSVGLLSDAMESLVNLAGATFALMMVSWAQQPADQDHNYGHHKAEFFSSGFEGVLIFVAALAILWTAGERLIHPRPLEELGLGMALSVASSVLNGALAWAMLRKAREFHSVALEADARHLYTDVWTSAGVLVGLLAAKATGWLWLDPAIAIAVGLNIIREGVHLIGRAVDGLMDKAVEPETLTAIEGVLERFRSRQMHFDHLVTRHAGQRRYAELHMHVPADWTLGRAAGERRAVEEALNEAVPGLRAAIQLWPEGDEPRWAAEIASPAPPPPTLPGGLGAAAGPTA